MKQKILRFVSKSAMFTASLGLVFSSLAPLAANAAQLTSLKDVPTRLKVGTVTSDHKIFMTTGSSTLAQNDVFVVDFSSAGADFTSSATSTWAYTNFAMTLNATSMDNAGAITGGTAAVISSSSYVNFTANGTLSYPTCPDTAATTVVVALTMTATTLVDPKVGFKLCGATPTAGASVVLWIKSGLSSDYGNSPGTGAITNSTAGSQLITVKARNTEASPTDTGYYALGIVADDQVALTSVTVDPSITFHAGAVASATACSTVPNTDGGSIAFGNLTLATVYSSGGSGGTGGDATLKHICTVVTTNAASGAAVTVVALYNAGLRSLAQDTSDTIASSATTMGTSTANFGLCVSSSPAEGSTAGTTLTAQGSYDGAPCTAGGSVNGVGSVSTTPQLILSETTGPTNLSYATIRANLVVTALTQPHTDYTNTFTFIGVGTF